MGRVRVDDGICECVELSTTRFGIVQKSHWRDSSLSLVPHPSFMTRDSVQIMISDLFSER